MSNTIPLLLPLTIPTHPIDPLLTYHPVKLRLREERQLLLHHAPILIGASIFLIYFALVVFRNLAYYRFIPAPSLRDIGHELLPEIHNESPLVDLPMYFFFVIFGLVALASMVPGTNKKPHFANILARLLKVYSVGHFLRACTYLSTSLPGTAIHCRPGSGLLDPPTSIAQCFTRAVSIQGGCGDLNFSGHGMLLCMGTLFVTMYGHQLLDFPFLCVRHISLIGLCIFLLLAQYYMILASRHHYTVDLVVASYTTPLLWYAFATPDVQPDHGRIRIELIRERTWPKWRRFLSATATFAVGIGALFALVITLKGNLKGLVGV